MLVDYIIVLHLCVSCILNIPVSFGSFASTMYIQHIYLRKIYTQNETERERESEKLVSTFPFQLGRNSKKVK